MKRLTLKDEYLFGDAVEAIDSHLKTVLLKCVRGEFESGTVTVKFNLSVSNEEKEVPAGIDDFVIKKYKKPNIKYSVSSNLKQSFKNDSSIPTDDLIIEFDGASILIDEVKDNQINMFD